MDNKIDYYLLNIHFIDNNQIRKYMLNLNLTPTEKQQLIIKLFKYEIERYNKQLYDEIINKYELNHLLLSALKNKIYENIINKYIYYKILSYDINDMYKKTVQNIINYPFNNLKKNVINELINININNSNNIIKEIHFEIKEKLNHLNNFIDKTNIFNKILNNCVIKDINKINLINEKDNINLDDTLINKYYNNSSIQLNQSYFKAAINFFLNNDDFINKVLNNQINNSNKHLKFYNLIKNIYIKTERVFNDLKRLDQYNKQDKNIDNYYIELKEYLNNCFNNIYCLEIPGFNLYPFYVIQSILLTLNDKYSDDCIIEYKQKYKDQKKLYILDCGKNYFLDDIQYIHDFKNYSIDYLKLDKLREEITKTNGLEEYDDAHTLHYSKINELSFYKNNDKYCYTNNICNYILNKNILKYPKNLLIACPIHDINGLYMINNKIKLRDYSYDNEIKNDYNERISTIISKIKKWYDISIIYPFILNINNNKYYLHSFIILINNELNNNYFVYYKIDYKEIDFNNENIDYSNINLLRFDNNKLIINKNNLNTHNTFIQHEYNTLINNNQIKDNLNYKIVFCYYYKF